MRDYLIYAGIGLFIILFFYSIEMFNRLVLLKNQVKKDWSNIDVLLKQRNSQLPKLIDTCKQYMEYEQETLDKIVKSRNSSIAAHEKNDITSLSTAESTMHSNLKKLFALSENYPDLKSNQNFLKIQESIQKLEDAIADRREVYNESANNNNTLIEQFPEVIIARLLGFKACNLLSFSESEIPDVDVKKVFKSN